MHAEASELWARVSDYVVERLGLHFPRERTSDLRRGFVEAARRRQIMGGSHEFVEVAVVRLGRAPMIGDDAVEVRAHARQANGRVNDARCRIGPGTAPCRARPAR